jgi:predicted alpha-1,2-mannosidase
LLVAAALAAATALPGFTATAHAATPAASPISLVNPLIGTENGADDFPGADAPFGMVQFSPDTPSRPDGGGYSYTDSSITGFSLSHISGPGCGAGGDVPILPTTGAVNGSATDGFSHSDESASPGYYSVDLSNGVGVELTATTRTGMAQFTFPATTQANLLFKLSQSQNGTSNPGFTVVSNTEVSGQVTDGHFCGAGNTYTIYFDMQFNTPFTSSGSFSGGDSVTFDTSSQQTILAKVGVSYVSRANAAANLAAENSGWNFSGVESSTQSAWNSLLGRIAVSGGTTAQQTVFYTALYHALLHPNVFSDVNGQYYGFDGKVHTVDSGHSAAYANYSGWDVYRSQAQLTALVDPSVASDIAQSMIDDYTQTGLFPKWSEDDGETYVMVGDPADSIIADYYSFGAHNFDTSTALSDMIAEATNTNNDRPGLNYLESDGYLPADGSYGCCNFYGPVSTTLEYDTADYAIASFAKQLGDSGDYTTFDNRAQDWHNLLNPQSGLMQPRQSDGSWTSNFSPTSQTDMVEGDSYQYTGMVPFDIAGLTAYKGGDQAMLSYLNLVLSGLHGAGDAADFGNEPSLELPWEYDYIGAPYLTQQVVREIEDQVWTDAPGGLAGNDDLGEMSSWYVFAALGMYPETPGSPALALDSPEFTQAVITLPSGNTLTINGNGAADGSPYIQSATWNGAAWNDAYVPTSAITSGGTLDFTLGSSPDTSWASAAADAPPSDSGNLSLPAAQPSGPVTSGVSSSLCLDDSNSGTSNGNVIQIWDCNQTNAQTWVYTPGDGLSVMGKCLDVPNSSTTQGTKVQLYDCNGTDAQLWQHQSDGAYLNPNSNMCLDDPNSSTSEGTQLQIYTCNGTNAQNWTLP